MNCLGKFLVENSILRRGDDCPYVTAGYAVRAGMGVHGLILPKMASKDGLFIL